MTEELQLRVDSRQANSALLELQNNLAKGEQGTENVNEKLQKSFDKLSQFIVTTTDKATKSMTRHAEAVKKMADEYNKLPAEKLTVQLEKEIKAVQASSLSIESKTKLINSLTASYQKMIAAEEAASKSATTNSRQMMQMETALEKGMVNSNRAAASFITNVLGGGKAMQALWTAFSAAAFIGMIVQVGEAFKKWFDEVVQAPEKIRGAFRELSSETRLTNDELLVTADRLQNSINKFEHKPQNQLKLAIDEATLASDKLYASLDKSIGALYKLVEENNVGWWSSNFSNQVETTFIKEKVGGKTGKGGMSADLAAVQQQNAAYVNGATSTQDLEARQRTSNQRLMEYYQLKQQQFHDIEHDLYPAVKNRANAVKGYSQLLQVIGDWTGGDAPKDPTVAMELVKGIQSELQGKIQTIQGTEVVARLTKQDDKDRGAKSYLDTVEQLRVEVAKAQEDEMSGLQKIKDAHDEKVRQLQHEGHYVGVAKQLVEDLTAAETKRFNQEQSRLDAMARTAAGHSIEEAQVKAGYETFQATRRTGEYGPTDIDETYNYATQMANIQHQAAIDNLGNLKEEERGRARLAADTAQQVAYIDAGAKKEAETTRYLQEQDDIRKKMHLEEVDHQQKMMDLQTSANEQAARSATQHDTRMRAILSPLGGMSMAHQIQGVQADYQAAVITANTAYNSRETDIATKKAEDLAELNSAQAKDKETWQKKIDSLEDEHLKNVEDKRKEIDAARYSAQERIAELEMRQFEEIRSKTESLLHTLITNPKKFHKQLQSTIIDAALKPAEDMASTGISTEIYKMLHHGKLPGANAKLADIQGVGVTDNSLNVFVTGIKGVTAGGAGGYSVAPWASGGSGGAARSFGGFSPAAILGGGYSSFGGGFGGGGSWTPTGAATSERIMFGDGTSVDLGGGTQSFGGGAAGAGGFSPFSFGGGAGAAGGMGGASMISKMAGSIMSGGFTKGGAASNQSNPANILKNLKGTDWGFKDTRTYDDQGNVTGGAAAFRGGVAGAAIMGGGMALAENGLLGNNRGTTLGMFEGAAGGAAVGFEYGGPIGAAVGAAVGFGIGLGEKLAGVESPQNEAKRLVKQIYHVNIDSKMADQIVQIANTKYAQHVSIAVRDPDVRKMLELYAAGTGQKMPQSATTPHAGILNEQGGQLSQGASYQYGQAYTYQSNLPVSGGLSSTVLPNPSGNVPMSLNIAVNGQGAGQFLSGSVVTPEFVQAQWASAGASSNGRVDNSAMLAVPGLITG